MSFCLLLTTLDCCLLLHSGDRLPCWDRLPRTGIVFPLTWIVSSAGVVSLAWIVSPELGLSPKLTGIARCGGIAFVVGFPPRQRLSVHSGRHFLSWDCLRSAGIVSPAGIVFIPQLPSYPMEQTLCLGSFLACWGRFLQLVSSPYNQ